MNYYNINTLLIFQDNFLYHCEVYKSIFDDILYDIYFKDGDIQYSIVNKDVTISKNASELVNYQLKSYEYNLLTSYLELAIEKQLSNKLAQLNEELIKNENK